MVFHQSQFDISCNPCCSEKYVLQFKFFSVIGGMHFLMNFNREVLFLGVQVMPVEFNKMFDYVPVGFLLREVFKVHNFQVVFLICSNIFH